MREYKECYIAFLDLLGFKNLIEDKEKSCEDIAELFDEIDKESIVTIVEENRPLMDFAKLKKKIMSDSICLYVDSSVNNSLAGLVAACNHLQVRMLCRKRPILIRGSITKGEIYAEGDITFGPGVSKAYLLEEKTAKYPRIILTKELMDEWKSYDSHGKKTVDVYTYRDFDAFYAIDYLLLFYYWYRGKKPWENFENVVKGILDKETNPSIREKYLYIERDIPRVIHKCEEYINA